MNETKNTPTPPVPAVEARIDKMPGTGGKIKAFASVTIGGSFAVHGLRVIETDKGRFIAMPQDSYSKNGERKYADIFHAVTGKARTVLCTAVNDAYEQQLALSAQAQDAPGAGMKMEM